MPHYLIRFTTDEERVIRAGTIKPENRDGVDVYAVYNSARKVVAYLTAANVLFVEETKVSRKSDADED